MALIGLLASERRGLCHFLPEQYKSKTYSQLAEVKVQLGQLRFPKSDACVEIVSTRALILVPNRFNRQDVFTRQYQAHPV